VGLAPQVPIATGRGVAHTGTVKYGDDAKLVMICIDLIDDDVREPSHNPFASASKLTPVAQTRKLAQPLDRIQNALDDRAGSSRIVFRNLR